jgi:hypothetical protein
MSLDKIHIQEPNQITTPWDFPIPLRRGRSSGAGTIWATEVVSPCQDLLYFMYSATMSTVVSCLLFTRLGPDHPGARPAML